MDAFDMFYHILAGVRDNNGDEDSMWSDGDRIYCNSERLCDALAMVIKASDKDNSAMVRTGHYDSTEDVRNGTVDEYTGWWYVDIE